MAVACIDGQLLKLIESQSWFACLLLGLFASRFLDFIGVAVF